MKRIPRLVALACLSALCLLPFHGRAEEGDRTAGRKAGESAPIAVPAPISEEDIESEPLEDSSEEEVKPAKRSAKEQPAEEAEEEHSIPKDEPEPYDQDAPAAKESDADADKSVKKAAEESSSAGPAKILKVDYPDLESEGLYSSPQDGSLGRDLWTNTRRSALIGYLPQLNAPEHSVFLQSLTVGLLLSQANAGLIVNDVKPVPGEDLLTHRLMKLMDLGLSDQALKIYSELGQPPYHPNLAQAGIMALLFNGEKSLACLEYKTLEDRNFSGDFWHDISLYCAHVLDGKKLSADALGSIKSQAISRILGGGTFTFTYDAARLNEAPLVDRAILTAENIINFGGFSLENIKRIAPEHLTLALKKDNLSREAEFLLTMKMVEYGLRNKAEWEKVYASYKFNGPADEQKIIAIESLPGWQQLPALYQNAKTAGKGPEQKSFALRAVGYAATYGPAAVYPFAEMLASASPDNLSTAELSRIAAILHGADKDIPASWFDSLSKRTLGGERDMTLFVLSYVAKSYLRQDPADREKIMDSINAIKNSHMKESYKIIIENVDNPSTLPHNEVGIYENDADLTFAGNYVMPSKRVWDQLKASSQNQSIGETVLLSALLLHDKRLTDLYPGVLGDVLSSLRAVGLTKFSKNLAQQALLEKL